MENQLFEAPDNLQELVEAATAELLAMAKTKLVRRAVGRDRVRELTAILLKHWPSIRAELEDRFNKSTIERLEAIAAGLGERAWVVHATELAASEIGSDANKLRTDELSIIVAEHRLVLFDWAVGPFRRHPVAGPRLADIASGRGRRDSAEDVQRLVELFRGYWAEFDGKLGVTPELLDEAEKHAIELLQHLDGTDDNPTQILADRAYSAWHHDYSELRRTARYLAWAEPEVLSMFPGVRGVNPARPSPKPADAEPPAEPSEVGEDEAAQDAEQPTEQPPTEPGA